MSHTPLPSTTTALSVNERACALTDALCDQAAALGLAIDHLDGVRIVDAGIAAPGSVAAGLAIAEICLGGLGRVQLQGDAVGGALTGLNWLQVSSSQPVLACLASQYAGWSLSASKEETGGKKFFALGSGPARALSVKEPLFEELGYRDTHSKRGVLVLEVDHVPPAVVVDKVVRDCGLARSALTLILTPTQSWAGTTQVVARVLEVALHRAHSLGFQLAAIVEGTARAPLPSPGADGLAAMGRTNDAILYGGQVWLGVQGSAEAARELARALPSANSRDYGRPFVELFTAAAYDFYKLDAALFAPAEVWVSHVGSGQTWHAGALALDLLAREWVAQA
jgi:methenyltetrahydromethanopterin cyclohydrolase